MCHDCRKILPAAKPSTRVLRRNKGKPLFVTDCDLCGDSCRSSFLPKKNRPFLCGGCKEEEALDMAREQAALSEAEAQNHEDQVEDLCPREHAPEPPECPVDLDSEDGEPVFRPPPLRRKPTFKVSCDQCKKVMTLRFQPKEGKPFHCPDCYVHHTEKPVKFVKPAKPVSADAEDDDEIMATRIFFNIECIVCGKNETVDFVPKSTSEAICTDCFKTKRRK